MTHRIGFILASILLAAALAGAQPGSSGLTFLKLGVGGRAIGMGEAAAASNDPSTAFYNPAAAAFGQEPEIMLMHKQWFEDVTAEYLFAHVGFDALHFGLSIDNTSINAIEAREIPGPADATFDARNAAIGLTAAYRFDSTLAVGATGKFLYEKILVDEASGWGFDLGATYATPWAVRLGAAVNNLGTMSVLRDEASLLPTIYRLGAAYDVAIPSLAGTATLAADFVRFSRDDISHAQFGGEYVYNGQFALRAGYETGYESRSFTAGLGIHYGSLLLDYAFMPNQYDLGSSHTISLSLKFQ